MRDWLRNDSGWDPASGRRRRHRCRRSRRGADLRQIRAGHETRSRKGLHMTTWMLDGGAGYIGRMSSGLQASGRDVVADDLSTGFRARSAGRAAGAGERRRQRRGHGCVARARRGRSSTWRRRRRSGESVERPEYYYRENVDGMLTCWNPWRRPAPVTSSTHRRRPCMDPAEEFSLEDAVLQPESPTDRRRSSGNG